LEEAENIKYTQLNAPYQGVQLDDEEKRDRLGDLKFWYCKVAED
jgi:hypothetical protein